MSKAFALGALVLGLWAGPLGCELIASVDSNKVGGGGQGGATSAIASSASGTSSIGGATASASVTATSASSTNGTGGSGGTTSASSAGGAGGSGGTTSTSSAGGAGGSGGTTSTSSAAGGAGGSGGATSTSSAGGAGGSGGAMCVPVDDNNPCTDDICVNGAPVNKPKAAGSMCSMGGTQCDGNGACVTCLAATDCGGADDACQTRTCTAGKCGFDFAVAGTVVPMQTAGDCKKAECDGNGITVQANDDTDLPDDANACTDDLCNAGVASHTNKVQGTPCEGVLVCDGNGTCVGCNAPSDCPGVDDECKTRTCVASQCGESFTGAGTAVAAQTPNNCLKATCDGAGNVGNIPDNTDLPVDDGNACTDEVCNAGVPGHPAKPNGAVCSDGDACTVADTCQSGACTSGAPVTCAAQDQCHTAGTCNPGTGICSNPSKADGLACNDGSACTQSDTCQSGNCTGASPVICVASDQCHAVGTCDISSGLCSNPAQGDGTACNDGNACTQSDTCQSGTCSGSNPVTCSALDECHLVGSCDVGTGTCSNPPAPVGTLGAAQTPGDCEQNECDGSGNLGPVADNTDVPADDGNQCTAEICTAGVPSHPAQPPGTACNQGVGIACDGFGDCVPAPAIASTSPFDGAAVAAAPSISVTFTTAMNPATLTGQTVAGACSGSIQVSLDSFASCVAFSSASATMSGGNSVATFSAAPGLLVNRTYQIRVTTAATSAASLALAAQFTQPTGFTTTSPNLCDGSVVISQVYGGGGGASPTYGNDYIELHNRGSAPVNVNGWAVQYASAAGTSWSKTALPNVSIQPGAYLLVQESGGSTGVFLALPTPDATGTISMAAGAGKVALTNNGTTLSGGCPVGGAIVDFVGYAGTATCFEGAAATGAPSSTTAALRIQSACGDVNNNTADFVVGAPTPRNSMTAASTCGCTVENESNAALEADFCDVQFPQSLSAQTGMLASTVFGQVYEAGVTEAAGANSSVRAQVGYGPVTANPEYEAGWVWTNATYNVQVGNNDEYQASFTAPAVGTYDYVYRVSLDQGVSWTYCDGTASDGGAGSNAGLSFDLQNETVLTVTP